MSIVNQGHVPPFEEILLHSAPTPLQAVRSGDLCDFFCSEQSLNCFKSEIQGRNCSCPGCQLSVDAHLIRLDMYKVNHSD